MQITITFKYQSGIRRISPLLKEASVFLVSPVDVWTIETMF